MSIQTIDAVLTRCREKKPIVTLESRPFNGTEMTPDNLRALAEMLVDLADISELTPTLGKNWMPKKVSLSSAPAPTQGAGQ